MNESRSFPDGFGLEDGSSQRLIDRRDTHFLARRDDFRLGDATIRPSIRTLEGKAGSQTLEPRVMQVLLALADARGTVLTREDLNHICWKDQIVGDDAINRAIKEVRRAARECDAGFVIETIPRIGFRLSSASGGEDPQVPVPAEALPLPTEDRPRLNRRFVLGAGLATAAGGLAWIATRSSAPDEVAMLMEESQKALRTGSPDQELRAIEMLEKAVTLAPKRADTWGLLALTRARVTEHALDVGDAPVARIAEAADRALKLDPSNADAMAAKAVAMPYYGDWLAAEKRFDGVIARHPDHIIVRDARAFFLGAVGRMKESGLAREAFADKAPLDANLQYRHVYAKWFLGEIAAADRIAARGLEIWPKHAGLWFARLWVLAGTDRIDRALAHLEDAASRPPMPAPVFDTIRLAFAASASGNPGEASAAAQRIMFGAQQNVAGVVSAIMLLNQIGALDEAFALSNAYYLEKGPFLAAVQWKPGEPSVPDQRRRKTNMLFTPTAQPMQRDPRFLPLVEEMGLAEYWDRSGSTPDFLAQRT